jgi:hypothetical protein
MIVWWCICWSDTWDESPSKWIRGYGIGWNVIRLQHIYNFWCSMLVFTPFAYCFITLRGTFMHFSELTY